MRFIYVNIGKLTWSTNFTDIDLYLTMDDTESRFMHIVRALGKAIKLRKHRLKLKLQIIEPILIAPD